MNAAILLADFYREPGRADAARARELLGLAASMITGARTYASHYYNPGNLPGGREWLSTLHANARQALPWGWRSNACPSLAATAWGLLVNAGFNPFELGGGFHPKTARALGLAGGN